jgi:glycosyltransferase involved in cell wall biosynthesis
MNSHPKSPTAKVLLLVENNSFPFDSRVRREAHALRDAGYGVTVIAPRDKSQPWHETLDGITVYRFPAPPSAAGLIGYAVEFGYATMAMLMLTLWVALRHGLDVIHAANPPDTMFLIGLVFKPFGVRFVFDHHDLSPEIYLSRFRDARRNLVYRTLRLLERLTFATSNVVIVTNESYKRVAIERGKVDPRKVFVVRNGPPLSFQPMTPDAVLTQRAAHIVGYIGTMGPQDGVDYWLRAIREMVFTLGRRDFLAVIIGSGDAEASLRALASELGIEEQVWFTGRINDPNTIRAYLSSADICVQPDPSSPLNDKSTMIKIVEYMALGKPTVAFDLPETRISGGDSAIYVSNDDELEFARQVCGLLDDPVRRQRLGEIGRMRVVTALAWEYSVSELLRAYREGLGFAGEHRAVEPAQQ